MDRFTTYCLFNKVALKMEFLVKVFFLFFLNSINCGLLENDFGDIGRFFEKFQNARRSVLFLCDFKQGKEKSI